MVDAIEETFEVDETATMDKTDFAAVPVHYRPGAGKDKKIKLVIPGIEPPLGYFVVTGETPDTITIEEVDPSDSDDVPEAADDTVVEETTTTPTDNDESPDTEGSASPIDDTEGVPDERDVVEYPYEDDSGNAVAGFLVAKDEDTQPPVIVVKPQYGEEAKEAVDRVHKGHPDHKIASLDEVTVLLGHSPLTAEDN